MAVPSVPTNVTATLAGTTATVSWTASTGTPTGYTVATSAGSQTTTVGGSTTSASVVGLYANGTVYTFTVFATNGSGNSAASTASNPVQVPVAPSDNGTLTAAAAAALVAKEVS